MAPTFGQTASSVASAAPEESVARVLDVECEAIRAEHDVPGLVALAMRGGDVVMTARAGVRSVERQDPVQIDDPFALGSCGKAMTSTLIAHAIERGDLDWSTTVVDGLPELEDDIHVGYRDVTVEQLLSHLGGIAERTDPEVGAIFEQFSAIEGTPREQRWEIARRVLAREPTRPPGESSEYSNYGYMIAAAILENLTDREWHELIETDLFEAMGLESAGYGSPIGADVPVGHRREGEEWVALEPGPASVLPECMAPAGLEHMNLHDWGRFVRSHVLGVGGADGYVTAESYRRLHERQHGIAYTCGWGVAERPWAGGEAWTHNGSDTTWYAQVWASPGRDLVFLAAANCGMEASGACDTIIRTMIVEMGLR